MTFLQNTDRLSTASHAIASVSTFSVFFGPIPWGHSGPLSRVVVVVVGVVVDINVQAARDSTAGDIW